MERLEADVAVLGAGFGGSLTALILSRIGLRVVLIERGRHPRFALGESSTPIADFVLARLAQRYDLPRLLPLCKYGTWKREYPDIACGCKRGFSYFHHERGRPFAPRLITPTSCWSRPVRLASWRIRSGTADVDHFFVREAVAAGVTYLDDTTVEAAAPGTTWVLNATRHEKPLEIRARFVVDATGSGSLLASTFHLVNEAARLRTNTRSVYGHFRNVKAFADAHGWQGGAVADHPFPCDEAAQHQIIDGGWMWLLRFDNGITSAGLVIDRDRVTDDKDKKSADEQWHCSLADYPSIAATFEGAEPTRPLTATDRLQRRWSRCAGENWAMVPGAAYTLDPLHSTGIAHNLLGVERLAAILGEHFGRSSLAAALAQYEGSLRREIDHLDRLVHGCYATMADFPRFVDYSMLYFLAATYSEHRCRASGSASDGSFLLAGDRKFTEIVEHFYVTATGLRADNTNEAGRANWARELAAAMVEYNVAGLCDPKKMNMYPFLETALPNG